MVDAGRAVALLWFTVVLSPCSAILGAGLGLSDSGDVVLSLLVFPLDALIVRKLEEGRRWALLLNIGARIPLLLLWVLALLLAALGWSTGSLASIDAETALDVGVGLVNASLVGPACLLRVRKDVREWYRRGGEGPSAAARVAAR